MAGGAWVRPVLRHGAHQLQPRYEAYCILATYVQSINIHGTAVDLQCGTPAGRGALHVALIARQTDRPTFLCIPRQSECSYLFRAELWVEWRCAPTSYQLTVPFFWLTTSRHCAVGPRCFQTIWRPFLQEIKHTDVFLCIAALKMRPICCLETSRTD